MILDAAAHLFLAHGYRRTGIADVAAQVDLAKGTIYLYVRSKDELFEATLQHLINGFLEEGRVALHGPGTMVRRLTHYLDAVVGLPGRMMKTHPYGAEMLEHRNGRTAALLRRFELAIHRDVHTMLDADRYPIAAGEFVVAAAQGHKRMWRDAESFRSRLEKHLYFLLTGLKR
jgi:AcrR family transcriptional regulator